MERRLNYVHEFKSAKEGFGVIKEARNESIKEHDCGVKSGAGEYLRCAQRERKAQKWNTKTKFKERALVERSLKAEYEYGA